MNVSAQSIANAYRRAGFGSPACSREHVGDEGALVSDGTCLFSPDGRYLVRCTGSPTAYCVPEGVQHIDVGAFSFQRQLERVELPASLISIGDEAFYACNRLSSVNIPEGVRSVGKRAFFCTVFPSVHLPASLDRAGELALVSLAGLHRMNTPAPSITVDPANQRFFVDCDFLCEREDDGSIRAVRYVGNDHVVRIPPEATRVSSYALLGARETRALHVHTHIEHLGINAVVTYQPMDYIRVDLPEGPPAMFYPAETCRALPSSLFCGQEGIVELARSCDDSLFKMKPGSPRTRRIVARMLNGRIMDARHRERFHDVLKRELDASLEQLSRADDETSLRGLATLGIVNDKNIEHAVEIANRVGSVSATHALLEAGQHMREQGNWKRSALGLDL